MPSVAWIDSGSTFTLTRIKRLLKVNEVKFAASKILNAGFFHKRLCLPFYSVYVIANRCNIDLYAIKMLTFSQNS